MLMKLAERGNAHGLMSIEREMFRQPKYLQEMTHDVDSTPWQGFPAFIDSLVISLGRLQHRHRLRRITVGSGRHGRFVAE